MQDCENCKKNNGIDHNENSKLLFIKYVRNKDDVYIGRCNDCLCSDFHLIENENCEDCRHLLRNVNQEEVRDERRPDIIHHNKAI